jgi:RimJ/RimL family protein N-acetyltransferase
MYESICCASHSEDDKYQQLFKTRPEDIVGRHVRLEALQIERHLQVVFDVTSGEPALENKSFDPEEIWGFQEDGPFEDAPAMRKSFVFEHLMNEAGFAIVQSVTDRVMGAVHLTHDDPQNLTIQLEAPLMQPSREGSQQQLEACFLLMDRVFAYGYRRIQICIDSQDANKRKWALRLGFTLEGILYKHMIIKEASRDSNVYGLINSDWKRGARAALFKKLYGAASHRVDTANEQREAELDEQEQGLKEKKRLEAEEASKDKNI